MTTFDGPAPTCRLAMTPPWTASTMVTVSRPRSATQNCVPSRVNQPSCEARPTSVWLITVLVAVSMMSTVSLPMLTTASR